MGSVGKYFLRAVFTSELIFVDMIESSFSSPYGPILHLTENIIANEI